MIKGKEGDDSNNDERKNIQITLRPFLPHTLSSPELLKRQTGMNLRGNEGREGGTSEAKSKQ